MKVKIPAIMGRSDAAEYVRLMLRAYEDVYLDPNDIEVETFQAGTFTKLVYSDGVNALWAAVTKNTEILCGSGISRVLKICLKFKVQSK